MVLPIVKALEILEDIKSYMRVNGEDPEDPESTFYEIYYSKAQVGYF